METSCFSFKFFIASKRLVAFFESSAPVGSSPNIIAGSCTSARAAAERCFCPPDTSDGYFRRISVIPNIPATFSTFGPIFLEAIPCNESGNAIFS